MFVLLIVLIGANNSMAINKIEGFKSLEACKSVAERLDLRSKQYGSTLRCIGV